MFLQDMLVHMKSRLTALNNPALQNTSLCNEMRKAHDFDELVRRSIERVPDIVYYPLLWRDIFGAFFPVLLVILAVWRSRRKTDSFCLEHDQDTRLCDLLQQRLKDRCMQQNLWKLLTAMKMRL
jgi:hypothetical protein